MAHNPTWLFVRKCLRMLFFQKQCYWEDEDNVESGELRLTAGGSSVTSDFTQTQLRVTRRCFASHRVFVGGSECKAQYGSFVQTRDLALTILETFFLLGRHSDYEM
jgi:hypothetical protein